MFGLSSTKHLRRNAVLHPRDDVVMMWCGLGLNTITLIASDLCRASQKYPYTVRIIISLQQAVNMEGCQQCALFV
jgi:hypothetical protein